MPDPFDQLAAATQGDQPSQAFAAQLRARLDHIEARANAARARAQASTESDPPTPGDESMPQLIPYLAVSDARAATAFYCEVFGAQIVEHELFEMPDGRIGHTSLLVGGHELYLADEHPEIDVLGPQTRGGTTVSIVIEVDDADATYAHAVDAGATGERPVENQHGARSGWFVDPWGHRWSPRSEAR
ncbi:MAG: VOC family protein [Actinomycetota bacterium]